MATEYKLEVQKRDDFGKGSIYTHGWQCLENGKDPRSS